MKDDTDIESAFSDFGESTEITSEVSSLPGPEVAIDIVTCKCKKSCLNKDARASRMASSVRMPVTDWIIKIRTKDLNQYPLMMSFNTVILLTNASV